MPTPRASGPSLTTGSPRRALHQCIAGLLRAASKIRSPSIRLRPCVSPMPKPVPRPVGELDNIPGEWASSGNDCHATVSTCPIAEGSKLQGHCQAGPSAQPFIDVACWWQRCWQDVSHRSSTRSSYGRVELARPGRHASVVQAVRRSGTIWRSRRKHHNGIGLCV